MSIHRIKAGINLYAVLKNLEDLIALDNDCKEFIRNTNISVQFIVRKGPKAWIRFINGQCEVGQGKLSSSGVVLYFTCPEHLNKMFDGKANPIPLKGFTKLGFLKNEFSAITEKLAYYLRPEEVKNPTDEYVRINTRFTLTVAAFALSEISKYDKKAGMSAAHIPDGSIQMRVLPDGPSVYLTVKNGEIIASKGQVDNPDAIMEMKDYRTANAFLNGLSNPFKAIAAGDVMVKGQIPMLDNLSLILDKVQYYVS
jgi:putative sterol carrier protein